MAEETTEENQQPTGAVLDYTEKAHALYEEAGSLDAVGESTTARETCLNLAYAYSILARRAAEQLEKGNR